MSSQFWRTERVKTWHANVVNILFGNVNENNSEARSQHHRIIAAASSYPHNSLCCIHVRHIGHTRGGGGGNSATGSLLSCFFSFFLITIITGLNRYNVLALNMVLDAGRHRPGAVKVSARHYGPFSYPTSSGLPWLVIDYIHHPVSNHRHTQAHPDTQTQHTSHSSLVVCLCGHSVGMFTSSRLNERRNCRSPHSESLFDRNQTTSGAHNTSTSSLAFQIACSDHLLLYAVVLIVDPA